MAHTEEINKLSILMAVFNETRTIEAVLDSIMKAPLPCAREIVIVDDGSTDGTQEILREYAARHECVCYAEHDRNRGKGAAIVTAIEHMTGDWAVFQDADLEYDPNEYERLLEPVLSGMADAVYGSRFIPGQNLELVRFWHTVANKTLTLVANMLTDHYFTDVCTCYKLVRASILKDLRLNTTGFPMDSAELSVKLVQWGARICEVPISYRARTWEEGKKVGFRDAFGNVLTMVRYRFIQGDFSKDSSFVALRTVQRARRFNLWKVSQFSKWLGDEVLELNSTLGVYTARLLHKKRLVCVDRNAVYVDQLNRAYGHLANVTVVCGDLNEPGDVQTAVAGGKFDSVICVNVLEHLADEKGLLSTVRGVLKADGRAVFMVPHGPSLFCKLDESAGRLRRYGARELIDKVEEAGFRVVKHWRFNRIGGLSWRISGRLGGRTVVKPWQVALFDLILPVVKLFEWVPYHSHNALVVVAERNEHK